MQISYGNYIHILMKYILLIMKYRCITKLAQEYIHKTGIYIQTFLIQSDLCMPIINMNAKELVLQLI